jgi:eukaryotic-like serine/threonine-protein kinase
MVDEPGRVMKAASREQAVFAEALACSSAAARVACLAASCGPDLALRRRVEALLQAAENAGDFLEVPPEELGISTTSVELRSDLSEHPGDRIGRYKLLEKIGEGGWGVVYMAEQEEPVRRRVALKVIKLGMDTRQVVARFEAERQALALMEHPNIARVLDGGATRGGLPYFVMELVRGVRITEFCEEARLSTRSRLQLFVQVCQAVQHAHQKGIIHRDLKPSNILVTVNDGAPVPKVIDFGIAKATGQRLTDKTLFTHFHSFIGTPAYTSPEQAEMSSVDIDTRSDIYSLGVLLYELLTGKTPFDGEELLRSGLDELRRVIREAEPPRPSTRLASLAAAHLRHLDSNLASGKAESRDSNSQDSVRRPRPTHELINAVRGDLDWIVMKCLEKDRTRRYETANGLAMDIQRHLNSEPVIARPPSTRYLLQKMAQRNRGTLTAAATVLVVLLAAVLTLARSNADIRQERNHKDEALRERTAALEAARDSEQRAREQLFMSLQSQAQARRNSRQMGQRLESLAALAAAARIRVTPELRDQAIAAMAIPDIDHGPIWKGWSPGTVTSAFDALYQRSADIQSDGLIRIRSIPENREIQRVQSSPGGINRVQGKGIRFSPNGHFLAKIGDDGHLELWHCETGEKVLGSQPQPCHAVAFSPDGRQIAVGGESSMVCFDLATGQEQRRWQVAARPHALQFNPDSRSVAVGYSRADIVSVYDAEDGRHRIDLPVRAGTEVVIAWHPGGELLAVAGSDPRIQIWNVETQSRISVLDSHVQQVTILSFHPHAEMLLSASWDGARLWQASPARLLMRLPLSGWTGFSADGRWAGWAVSGSPPNYQAQVWGVIPSQEYRTFLNTFSGRSSVFREGDISPNGQLLALGASDGVRLWDVERGYEVAHLEMGDTTAVLFRAEGRELLTCGPADGLRRWHMEAHSGPEGGYTVGPSHQIALPFAPERFAMDKDGRSLAVVGESAGETVLLDLVTESRLLPQMLHQLAGFVALSPDAVRLATSGWHSEQVKLWDGQTGRLLWEQSPGLISRVFFTPDQKELIVARDREFTFHDLGTLEVSRRLSRDLGLYPGYIAFNSDGKLMALEMAPGQIHLKETATGRTVAQLEDPQGDHSTWMSFTPDDTRLVVAARYSGAIHRWDLRSIRDRLKPMNLDWDWPEFPAEPAEKGLAKRHRPLRVQVLDMNPADTRESTEPTRTRSPP